ncbi:MAG: class I SAM-dependent methyltransferase [Candidatus Omnitrophica bacterium]|nr:class I SAM-dependent methyltransferase [Candidatus Omnitrophota bacterium]
MKLRRCRMCHGSRLETYLDLGATPLADGFLRADQLHEPEAVYPLAVALCKNCGLSQLTHVVSPEILYCRNYPYESSTTVTGRQHWAEFAATVTRKLSLQRKDLVVDIGSNVGVLLAMFRKQGVRVVGVDPASNIVAIARRRGIPTECGFFDVAIARTIVTAWGRAALATATNTFAHINDLDRVAQALKILLQEDGVFVLEAPHFLRLLQHLEYDTIYHEHLSYLTVKSLARFFHRFRMEVFDVEERPIHGGSIRVYVQMPKGRRRVQGIVGRLIREEERHGAFSLQRLRKFAAAVRQHRDALQRRLQWLKRQGNVIAGVSAPAKGMTLLNYCRLGPDVLDFISEKSTLKIGRFTPGVHVPVVSDEKLLKRQPDYALILAWNFAPEIMGNLESYRRRGGKFIIPIPRPRIIA